MTYRTLMVALEPGRSNARILSVAGGLVARLGAGVVGVAACQPIEVICPDYPAPAKLFDEDRKRTARQLAESEEEFRAALAGCAARLEWRARSAPFPLAEQLAREARSADLVLVSATYAVSDRAREVDLSNLVMQVGRPVLVVPAADRPPDFGRILVGWKDRSEAQRAVLDALPLLIEASDVMLVGIGPLAELDELRRQVDEVAAWLKLHGVPVRPLVQPARGSNADQIRSLAEECDAGAIVAGAYGHLRQREWVLGGVTTELLRRPGRCVLLSH